jgi:hypothetical protein
VKKEKEVDLLGKGACRRGKNVLFLQKNNEEGEL